MTKSADIGVFGLSVMGGNLARNFAGHGFTTAVYTRSRDRLRLFSEAYIGENSNLISCEDPGTFCRNISVPRKILIMVKAGEAVDDVIQTLLPHLERGDILIDGGNSHYTDTARRADHLESAGINFVGMGISGGEEGALNGPALMPGAVPEIWEQIKPVFTAVAAKAPDGTPCCKPLWNPAAGHFVKMVHNGIEYADMQLIAESWMLLKHFFPDADIPGIFREWNQTELQSYLIGITADILEFTDPATGKPLTKLILDKAEQKGTGLWTTYAGLDLKVPLPGISEAVAARMISNMKDKRVKGEGILSSGLTIFFPELEVSDIKDALYAAKICSYSQGFALFAAANDQYEWVLNPADIASIWRAGCIIRAAFLDDIAESFRKNPGEENLILQPFFTKKLKASVLAWRKVTAAAVSSGLPVPVLSTQLSYYDSMRTAVLPANLIQAQRDYFGAHTYERIDRPGEYFHTKWY